MSPLDPSAPAHPADMLPVIGAIGQWLLAPCLALLVSVLYYLATPRTQSMLTRVAVSAHGAVIALIYFAALLVFQSNLSSPRLQAPFLLSLLIPVGFAVFSFFRFRGKRSVHALQLINLVCLAWTAFIGIMAVTGDWL